MMALVAPLAVELAPKRIRVNAVVPSTIETAALEKLALTAEQLGAFDKWISGRLLVGRPGTAEDVARLVAFLVSPAAGFITGSFIPIDGGMGVTRPTPRPRSLQKYHPRAPRRCRGLIALGGECDRPGRPWRDLETGATMVVDVPGDARPVERQVSRPESRR
jgi:hypothetical protein